MSASRNFDVNISRDRFFFQAEDGIRDHCVTGVQTCALPIYIRGDRPGAGSDGGGPASHQRRDSPLRAPGRLGGDTVRTGDPWPRRRLSGAALEAECLTTRKAERGTRNRANPGRSPNLLSGIELRAISSTFRVPRSAFRVPVGGGELLR